MIETEQHRKTGKQAINVQFNICHLQDIAMRESEAIDLEQNPSTPPPPKFLMACVLKIFKKSLKTSGLG